MHDLDDDRDPYPPPWYSGPPPARTSGPIVEAYADTLVLEYACPHCGAQPGDFCRHDAARGGVQRKVPCPRRILVAAHATEQREGPS